MVNFTATIWRKPLAEATVAETLERKSQMKKRLTYWAIGAVLLIAGFTVFWQISKSRTFQLLGEIVPRVETSQKVVALTFDDGPTVEGTNEVLAILKAHN